MHLCGEARARARAVRARPAARAPAWQIRRTYRRKPQHSNPLPAFPAFTLRHFTSNIKNAVEISKWCTAGTRLGAVGDPASLRQRPSFFRGRIEGRIRSAPFWIPNRYLRGGSRRAAMRFRWVFRGPAAARRGRARQGPRESAAGSYVKKKGEKSVYWLHVPEISVLRAFGRGASSEFSDYYAPSFLCKKEKEKRWQRMNAFLPNSVWRSDFRTTNLEEQKKKTCMRMRFRIKTNSFAAVR